MHPPDPDSCRPAEPIEQQALDWFVQTRAGLTPAQRLARDEWLRHDAHQQAYDTWEAEWRSWDAIPEAQRAALLDAYRTEEPPTRHTRRRLLAGLGLTAAASWMIIAGRKHWPSPAPNASFVSATGDMLHTSLPGGGELVLDSATHAETTRLGSHNELILRDGQMLVDTPAAGIAPAMHLLVGNLRIIATGARLSVRHTPAQPGFERTRVAVAAGQVQVLRQSTWLPPGWGEQALADLSAGQSLRLMADDRNGRMEKRDTTDIAPWLDGRLVVENLALDQVLTEFARYGHAMPRIPDPRVAAMRLTGTFHTREPATFYQLLPQILPVRVETSASGYRILGI